MPTNVTARMTLAADPDSLQGAVAAGILGAGPVVLGTAEECARLLERTLADGADPSEVARGLHRVPGFGHPVHKPVDPRAERILELADERGISGPHVALARRFHEAVGLTMNVSIPIAAVLLDLGYPASFVKAIPILARTASLLAHLAEEQEQPIGFDLARAAEEAAGYRND
jgi:citrate synthase